MVSPSPAASRGSFSKVAFWEAYLLLFSLPKTEWSPEVAMNSRLPLHPLIQRNYYYLVVWFYSYIQEMSTLLRLSGLSSITSNPRILPYQFSVALAVLSGFLLIYSKEQLLLRRKNTQNIYTPPMSIRTVIIGKVPLNVKPSLDGGFILLLCLPFLLLVPYAIPLQKHARIFLLGKSF